MILPLAVIALYLAAAGFFAGIETGFYSVSSLRLRLRLRSGQRDAAVVRSLLDRLDETVVTTLIGTNIALYGATAVATQLWTVHARAELWATLSMTPLIFVFSEMFPKDLFRNKADSLTYRLAGPFDAFRLIASPVTALLRGLVAALTRRIPAEERHEALAHLSPGYVLAQTQRRQLGTAYHAALSSGATRLLGREVGSAMVPLRKVAMVEADLHGAALREAAREAGHSWLPVFQDSRTNILGILDVFDCVSGLPDDANAGDRAHPAPRFLPSESSATVLLALRGEYSDMALIVDDDGDPIGIVTARDLADAVLRELGPIGTR